jgi:hypothetical protein
MNVRARGFVRVALLAAGFAAIALVTLAATTGFAATRHSSSAIKVTRPTKNIPGPRGPRGFRGPRGPKGDSATSLWALVASNGTLIKGSGVATATKSGTDYRVIFNRDVTNCGTVATPTQASLAAADIAGSSTVAVAFRTSNGAAVSTQFSLAVFC